MSPVNLPLIGKPRDRVDARVKVTGAARYAAENNMKGLVHAVVVAATIPSGVSWSPSLAVCRLSSTVFAMQSPSSHIERAHGNRQR